MVKACCQITGVLKNCSAPAVDEIVRRRLPVCAEHRPLVQKRVDDSRVAYSVHLKLKAVAPT